MADDILVIEDISKVGQSDGGDNIALVIKFKNVTEKTVLIPIGLFAGFTTALFAAGSASYREKLARFGTEQRMLDAFGVASFTPTGFSLAQGNDDATQEDLILLRLKKDDAPVVDVILGFEEARKIGDALIAAAEQRATSPSSQRLQ